MDHQPHNTDKKTYVFDINEDEFATKIINASDKKLILVDFWAPWCEPCKQLGPLLEEIVQECNGQINLAKNCSRLLA